MATDNKNSFQTTVDSLFKGMDSFITTKTVVGDAITLGDTIILPLVDVTFGVAATASLRNITNTAEAADQPEEEPLAAGVDLTEAEEEWAAR